MANVSVSPFSVGGYDNTQTHQVLIGNVAFTGNYNTGGLLPNWTSMTDTAGNPVVLSATPSDTGFPPDPILITQAGVASNVVTLLAPNTLKIGDSIEFFNLTANAVVLNGQTLKVVSPTNTGVITVDFVTPNFSNVAVSGQAQKVYGPNELSVVSVSGSGLTYSYNKSNATIQIFNGNVELANGSNLALTDTVQFTAEWTRN